MIDIYDYNGIKLTYSSVLCNLPITEACEHVEELMKSDYVALSWRDSQYYVLPVGAYIIYNGTTFLLLEPYEPEQKSEDEYEYKPQFQHPKMYLGKVPFSRPTKDSDANDINLIDWPYTGSLSTLLEYFCESIENALGFESGSFMYEIVGEIESIVSTTFSSIDILSALSNIANVLKCEWHIDLEQMTLYFGHIMIDHDEVEDTVLEVGRNIGIPSVRTSKEGFWNAFEPQGSTRNITRRAASGEYVQANVRLALDRDTYYHLNDEDYPDGVKTPEGIIYTDENGKVVDRLPANQKAYIKSLIFEDIFPKLDLYAYDVRCRERYLLDDQEQKVIDHYEGTIPIYKRYAVWYMRLAYPLYNSDKSIREWVDYNIKDVRDLTSKVVSISVNHSSYTSFVLDMAFSSQYFNNRSVSYPGSEEYPNYIVRIQAHDITIKGYITKDATNGKCSFYSESSNPQEDDRDEPDAAALRAFSDAIEVGDEILFVSGINASAFPAKYSQIIDGKELYCQFAVNKKSGAETTPLAGRGQGDDGNYGFALYYHEDDETIPPIEAESDTGVEIKKGDYEIVFQQQNDYILPTTYAQGLIPKGVKVDGHEVTDLNSLSDKSDGLKGNIVNLYNIVMDYTYEASAQNDLANETLKYIKNLFTDNNTYTFKSDNVAFKKDIDEAHASNRDPHLYIGQRVIYKNGDYELTTRVMKVVTKLDYEFEQEITVGNEVLKGAQTQLKEQVQTLISVGAGGEGGGQVSEAVIKKIVNNYVTPRFLSKINDDTAQGNIGFKEGVWFGDRRRFVNSEGDASFRDLNVEGKVITDWMQSSEYTGDGMLDTGYKLWYEEGRAKLVIDDLVARGKFTVNELETRIWTYAGGNMVFSGAGSTLFFVEYLDADENTLGYTNINAPWLLAGRPLLSAMVAWSKRRTVQRQLTDTEKAQVVKFRCYEYSDDGTMQTRNWWHANDIAMCETLNKVRDKANSDGSYSGYASNTVYKRRVAGIGSKEIAALNDGRVYDYVDLWNIYDVQGHTYIDNQGHEVTITDSVKGFLNMSPSGQTPSTDWPAAGDVIVQCGNPLDTDRQAAVTIEVQGDMHGFKVYDTINDYSMANKEWVEIGYDKTTGKAKANVYGDFRFGCRESEEAQGGSYVKYNRTTKVLDIKAKINAQSTMPYNGSDTTLANIFSGLNQQIDGKIETWQQDSDPANDWTTDDLKAKHVGDLWMDTSSNGGKKTYIYKDKGAGANPRYDWVQQDVPQAVFDGIDGKASVYSSWDAWGDKLHLRDLLIPSSDIDRGSGVVYKASKVYRCTQVNPPVFEEVAYTDDTAFNGYINALLNGTTISGDADTAAKAQHVVIGALKGDTVTDGGLLLTSLIAMRKLRSDSLDPTVPSNYDTWGGISGMYDARSEEQGGAKGHGIAAWYGGAMVDMEDVQTLPSSYAKSLFRMDGTGYLANGNIKWDANGDGSVAGGKLSWSTDNQGITTITLNGDIVKAANYYLNGNDITAQLDAILNMFEIRTINGVEWVHVKNNRPLYSDSDISAGGAASGGGGGGGGASALYELNDVTPNATHDGVYGAQDGYVLTYDASTTHWYAAPAAQTYVLPQATSGALGGIKIGFTTDSANKNYAVVLDNDGKAYVNVPWVSGSFGTESTDNVQITLGGTTKTVLTSHQSLSGYATQQWVQNQGYLTSLPSHNHDGRYYISSGTIHLGDSSITPITSHQDISGKLDKSGGTITGSLTVDGALTCQSVEIGHTNEINATDSTNLYIQYRNTGNLVLCSNGYNCGIGLDGNTNPTYKLQVNGSVYSGGDFTCNGGDITINEPVSGGAAAIWFQSGGTTKGNLRVKANGELYFYTGTGAETTAGCINAGLFYSYGDVTAASDKRKKDFVENANLTVEQIANAPAVKFRWKDKRDELVHVGTYAQYWQNVLPESVSEKNGNLGLNYGAAAMVSVVKVAQKVLTHEEEIEQLKKWYAESQDEIKAQKQRIRELEHEVERLKIA